MVSFSLFSMTIIIMRMMMAVMPIMADKAMINPSHTVKYQTKKDKTIHSPMIQIRI